MQFRLTYQGPLPATPRGRSGDKHRIRKLFHKQLVELVNSNPFLKDQKDQTAEDSPSKRRSFIDIDADNWSRCGYRFYPILFKAIGVACELNILFLRRHGPGDLVRGGGDIDNRIKILFDALRIPQQCEEVHGISPEPDEDPFFCLLEDDSLISEFSITTDRLLAPGPIDEVHLVVYVKSRVIDSSKASTEFYA